MSKATTFGQWLKQRRKVLGLTQKELAQQAGCAEVTLRKIEAGDLHPSAPLAASLAKAVGAADADLPGIVALARGARRRAYAGSALEQAAPSQQPPSSTHPPHWPRTRHRRRAQTAALRRRTADHPAGSAGRRQDPAGPGCGRGCAGALRARRLLRAPGSHRRSRSSRLGHRPGPGLADERPQLRPHCSCAPTWRRSTCCWCSTTSSRSSRPRRWWTTCCAAARGCTSW